MANGTFSEIDWGGKRTLWLDSDRVDECIAYYHEHGFDGLGINPLHGYKDPNIECLRGRPGIKGLVVVPSISKIDLSGISSLSELRYLSLGDSTQPLNLGSFPRLVEFRGDWHKRLTFDGTFACLRSLHLWKYNPETRDLSLLPDFPALEELEFVQGNLASLTGILRYSRLRRLELSYQRALRSLQPAEQLPALEELHCDRCSKLEHVAVIASAPSLRSLRLNSCSELPTLAFLDEMRSLRELRFVDTNVADGNLAPLLRLDKVGLRDKRHFTHTTAQIEAAILARSSETHT